MQRILLYVTEGRLIKNDHPHNLNRLILEDIVGREPY